MHHIEIDSEFQALIPPLSAKELAQLEVNLLADGCRDPLVVWGNTHIDGHTACIERQNPDVKARPARLMFGDQLRLKTALPVQGNIYGQLTKLALECLLAFAIAGIATGVGDGCVLVMPKELGHLGI